MRKMMCLTMEEEIKEARKEIAELRRKLSKEDLEIIMDTANPPRPGQEGSQDNGA